MSIETTGPEMYDFQDLACVAIMLRLVDPQSARFFVEPSAGEDAELHLTVDGRPLQIEIQVKGSTSQVTLDTVAACLVHTPRGVVEDTLLERLLRDDGRFAMLFMSGRCRDDCADYVRGADWEQGPPPEGLVPAKAPRKLLEAFSRLPHGDGIRKERRERNARFGETAVPKEVAGALSRLMILERETRDRVKERCASLLRGRHRVPEDRIDDLLRRLKEEVRNAKRKDVDVLALVQEALAKESNPSIRPADYVERGVEQSLLDDLGRDGVLLLSGMPRTGKTYAARFVASKYERFGYAVRELGDAEAAGRWLLEPGAAHRLAVVDDPLGTMGTTGGADDLDALYRVAHNIAPNRRMVVAQGQAQLLAAAGASRLSDVATDISHWRDMGQSLTATFLGDVWREVSEKFDVPPILGRRIAAGLEGGALNVEPGSLRHAAAQSRRLAEDADLDEVAQLARESAASLGRTLAETGCGKVMAAMAVATSPGQSIAMEELAFVLGAGGEALPGLLGDQAGGIFVGGETEASKEAEPGYVEMPTLGEGDYEALGRLERLGILEVSEGGAVKYSHPYYRAAGESVAGEQTYAGATKTVRALRRALFCLLPATSKGTARNLRWIWEALMDSAGQPGLVQCAIDGLRSSFPGTRDICYRFLVDRCEAPSIKKLQPNLRSWTAAVTRIDLFELRWRGGDAYLPPPDRFRSGDEFLERLLDETSAGDVKEELALLNTAESRYVSPEQASRALSYYRTEPSAMTLAAVLRLLSFDEAVLRAEAIKIWLGNGRDDDRPALNRIFEDRHPACAVAAVKAATWGWHEFAPARRKWVCSGLRSLAEDAPACAMAMLEPLVLFDRPEHAGENPPWELFGDLLPVVMRGLPRDVGVNEGRLLNSTRCSVGFLAPGKVVDICDGWSGWLEEFVHAGGLPSDYMFGVVGILIAATRECPELRAGRLKRLMSMDGTACGVCTVSAVVDAWNELTPPERGKVLSRVTDDEAADRRWMQAVAITRDVVPREIETAALGDEVSLADGVEALLQNVDDGLLKAAVHVFCGAPEPLWFLGTHHRGRKVWETVVGGIARLPGHPLFEIAWDELSIDGDGSKVAGLVEVVGDAHAERALDFLIRTNCHRTGDYMPEAWTTVLGMAPDAKTLKRWLDKVAQCLPAMLDELPDLQEWLGGTEYLDQMVRRILGDIRLLKLVGGSAGDRAPVELEWRVQEIERVLDRSPPRLWVTCSDVSRQVTAWGVGTAELFEKLNERRKTILAERDRIRAAWGLPDPVLEGWIGP